MSELYCQSCRRYSEVDFVTGGCDQCANMLPELLDGGDEPAGYHDDCGPECGYIARRSVSWNLAD